MPLTVSPNDPPIYRQLVEEWARKAEKVEAAANRRPLADRLASMLRRLTHRAHVPTHALGRAA